MTSKLSAAARAWFAEQGKIGGAKAVGVKKLRGDRAYYAELGRKAAAARKLNRLQAECQHEDFADTLAGQKCLACGFEMDTPDEEESPADREARLINIEMDRIKERNIL